MWAANSTECKIMATTKLECPMTTLTVVNVYEDGLNGGPPPRVCRGCGIGGQRARAKPPAGGGEAEPTEAKALLPRDQDRAVAVVQQLLDHGAEQQAREA